MGCRGRKLSTNRPESKGNQKANQFLNYCRTNAHKPRWCRRKIRDEKLKKINNGRTAEKKVTFSRFNNSNYWGQNHGSEQWTRGQDFQRRDQNSNNDGPRRNPPPAYHNFSPRPNSAHGYNNSKNERSYDHCSNQSINGNDKKSSRNRSFDNQNEKWRHTGILHLFQEEIFYRAVQTANHRMINFTILLSADPTIDWQVTSHLMNKNYHKTVTRRHPMYSASLQPTIVLTNYRPFVR